MNLSLEVNTRCINCDVCRVICPEDSITYYNQQYHIESWSCSLCGLCLELCPTEAIKLVEEDPSGN